MVSREILNSHPVSVLKKEISKTNIKGYSKMKKNEVVDLMLSPEHEGRFDHIEIASSKKKRAPRRPATPVLEAPSLAPVPVKEKKKPKKVNSFTVTKADGSKKEIKTGRIKRRAEEKKAKEKKPKDSKEKKPKKSSDEGDSKNMLKMMLKEEQANLAKLKKSKASKDDIKRKTELIGTIKLGIKSGFVD